MTQEKLKDILHYNPDTGTFIWKINRGRIKLGDIAGRLSRYIQIGYNNKKYAAHRLAWLYVYGKMPDGEIDHINHEKTDNRILNLRDSTREEQAQNMVQRKDNRSGTTGVGFRRDANKWHARITVDKKQMHIGYYFTKEEAIVARKKAETKHGFHKNHGKARLVSPN